MWSSVRDCQCTFLEKSEREAVENFWTVSVGESTYVGTACRIQARLVKEIPTGDGNLLVIVAAPD